MEPSGQDLTGIHERAGRTLQQISDGVLILEADGTIAFLNAAAGRAFGREADDLIGLNLWTTFPDAVGSPLWINCLWAAEHGEPVTFETYWSSHSGWFEVRAFPCPDGLSVHLRSVNAEHEAQRERTELITSLEAALDRGRQLLDLTRALAAALTVADVTDTMVQHASHDLRVSFAGIALIDETGLWVRFAETEPFSTPSSLWGDALLATSTPVADTARLGRPFFHGSVSAAAADFPDIRTRLLHAGSQAMAHLPLARADHTILGALALSWAQEHPMGAAERDFLTTMALHCGQALERALLFEQHQSVAVALQHAVLPDGLPDLAGWEMAARYVPASNGVEVGGDWYDAFTLPGGKLGLAVGDASGHGLSATRVMSGLRNALRAYAVLGEGPAAVLTRLNYFLSTIDAEALATVVYLEVEPDGTGRWAAAGHLPLLSCGKAGPSLLTVGQDRIDPPLGCLDALGVHEHEIALVPGEALLLYTDGLIERRESDLQIGLDRLSAVAGASAPQVSVHALVDLVLDDLLGTIGSGDDVCVVALRHSPVRLPPALEHAPQAGRRMSRQLPPRPQAPSQARRLARTALAGWQLAGAIDTAELVVSELVTNAVTHARTSLTLDIEVARDGRAGPEIVRISVTDATHVPPRHEDPGPSEEHGRGVQLIDLVSLRWGTDHLPVGKRVWAEISV